MRLAWAVALITASAVTFAACNSTGNRRRHNNNNDDSPDLAKPEEGADLKGVTPDLKKSDMLVTTGSVTIDSFEASPTSAVSGAPITFTVVVEVPSNDSVLSVQLTDTNKVVNYGELSSTGFAGSYSRTMSWAAISEGQDLTFTSGASRTFKVVVTTVNDKTAEMNVTVSFSCNGLAACSGVCTNTDSDNLNCGTCGNACSSGSCSGGSCGSLGSAALSSCVTASSKDSMTCNDVCTNQGSTCIANGCGGATMVYHYNSSCSTVTGSATGSCSSTLSTLHSGLITSDTVKCCCSSF